MSGDRSRERRLLSRRVLQTVWDRSESRPYLKFTPLLLWLCLASGAAAADIPWAIKDAPIRAVLTLMAAPQNPDTGIQLNVPNFGLVRPGAGHYTLLDPNGQPVPVALVWQADDREAILLAQTLQPGQPYTLYIGGAAPGLAWTPKPSLWLEARALNAPHGEAFTSPGAWQAAWNAAAPQTQGAAFVGRIFTGENPFGGNRLFLAHYSGYLAPTTADRELFTNSVDSSFVLVNDQPFTDWTGPPNGNVRDKTLRSKLLPASVVPTKIDYFLAKGDDNGPPNATLGWRTPGGPLEVVPDAAFLHPGQARVDRFESQTGAPVPAPEIALKSYLGYGGAFLYEVQGKLARADLHDTTVEWRFDDGAVLTGPQFTRVMTGTPDTQRVTVTATRANAAPLSIARRIGFYGKSLPEASGHRQEGARATTGHEDYVALLAKLTPAKLDAAMLSAALPLLFDNGTDAEIAAYANPWLSRKPNLADPLWWPAYSAHVRALAQTDPHAAIGEVAANAAARPLYGDQLNVLELDLITLTLHDLALLPRARQLAFNLSPKLGKLGDIRLGDLYRLNGDVDQANAHYLAAQPPDASGGRQLPTQDQANAMTVEDLLENGTRAEAMAKLNAWELSHPLTKFTTNFLVLRARVLGLYGRWQEALAELVAFGAAHPDSPYGIDVDFYRARALYELGKKDEARKIWQDLARDYPNSELAAPSREWAQRP